MRPDAPGPCFRCEEPTTGWCEICRKRMCSKDLCLLEADRGADHGHVPKAKLNAAVRLFDDLFPGSPIAQAVRSLKEDE